MAQDPEARSALAQGFILPYRKLREKMESRHRTWEKTPRMVLCVLPHPGVYQDGEDPELWDEIEKDFGGQVLDLTPYFNAYRTTYSPYSEASKEDHLDRQGHDLLARILRHVFIQRGWVPWEAPPAH
jgi:hypothetical protein